MRVNSSTRITISKFHMKLVAKSICMTTTTHLQKPVEPNMTMVWGQILVSLICLQIFVFTTKLTASERWQQVGANMWRNCFRAICFNLKIAASVSPRLRLTKAPFIKFSIMEIFTLQNYDFNPLNHIRIWTIFMFDICKIQMWYSIDNQCIHNSEKLTNHP